MTNLTAAERKQRPLFSGVLRYFPDALLEVAYTSFVGNEQHNPGQPLHWAKEKSTDELDALMRHLAQAGTRDTDGVRHSAKVAWRALANLQREIEAEQAARDAEPHEGPPPMFISAFALADAPPSPTCRCRGAEACSNCPPGRRPASIEAVREVERAGGLPLFGRSMIPAEHQIEGPQCNGGAC